MTDPVKKIKSSLSKKLSSTTQIYKEKRFLQELAEEAAEELVKRTQADFKGASKSGNKKSLGSLAPDTVKIRKKAKNLNTLKTSRNQRKSNLTATGQMLDSIFGKYISKSIVLDFKKGLRKFELLTDRPKTKQTNKQVAKRVQEDQGREFFNLSVSEIRNIERKIRNKIRQLLSKNN